MKSFKLPKAAKILLAILGSIISLIIIATIIVINFVLTPAKLTPIVLDQANTYLNAKVSCEAVDITLFKTFPQVGLRLKKGEIISNALHDSVANSPQDSLLKFNTCIIAVNPFALLQSNEIKINNVLIEDATIYAYKNKEGAANWDIALMGDTVPAPTDSLQTDSMSFNGKVDIQNIQISNANLTFDDRSTELFADLRNFNFKVSGSFSDIQNTLLLHLDTRNILIWQQGKLLVNKMGFGLDTHLFIDRSKGLYKLNDTQLEVNGIQLAANGTIVKDSVSSELDVNMNFGLNVPTLKTVLDLIPKSIVKESVDVTAKGAVAINGTLKGVYGQNKLPVFDVAVLIKDASAQYKGMPYGIDKLDIDLKAYLDFENKSESYLLLNKFSFAGASSKLNTAFKINSILLDPSVEGDINANINFTDLAKTFPLEEGVELRGIVDSKLKSTFRVSDVKNENWGKIGLAGSLKVSDIAIISPKDTFDLQVRTAGFAFGANNADTTVQQGKTLLNAIVGFDGFDLKLKNKLKAKANDVALHIKTSPLKDTTMIASMSATVGYSSLDATLNDSITIRTGAAKTTVSIAPSKRDKKLPLISSSMKFDSLYAAIGDQRMGLQLAAFDVKSEKAGKDSKHWISTGVLGFQNLKLFTPDFPLIISMPASKLSLGNDAITLNGAKVHIGSSDMTVTGQIYNLKNVFFDKATLYGKMSVASDFINCNEITKALEMVPENHAAAAEVKNEPVAEEPMKLFVVPDGIDFVLDIDIRKVLFGKLEIENIKGEMIIRNRSIELMDLNLHTMSADMNTTLVYSTKDTTSAYTGFDLKMKDIIVGKLVEFIPALDTLVPMLRSIDGRVNFNIAAEARLDSTMSIDIQSIQSAAKLKGDSLVLMDGETFSQISKMLRFKNRERNVIDSVSVDLIVRNGQIEIYPFLIGMDRYLAAVGGKHNIDMTFDYHVSLLKSPIPFNVGVDIKGSMDDFKFKITKARYKDLKNSVRQSPVDSAGLSVRSRMKEVLHEEAKSIQLKREISDKQFNQ